MIAEIRNVLGLNWGLIHQHEIDGVRYHKALDICKQVSLSNTTIAVAKVSDENKRKFTIGEIENGYEVFDVSPWFVNEVGVCQLLMLNSTPETQEIKNRVAIGILPLVRQL